MINYFVDDNFNVFKFNDEVGTHPSGYRYNYKTKEWKADDTVIARWYAIDPFDFGYDFDIITESDAEKIIRERLAQTK
jgi:hypothetical protein